MIILRNKLILSLILLVTLTSVAIASSGSFGEVSGALVYNAFLTTPQTRTWTIVNNFNYSLGFYIVKPNLTNASITTSVTNGIIAAGKFYPINVTIVSHTTDTQSGYITAYAISNNTNSTGVGSAIRLAVIKHIEITGTNTIIVSNSIPLQGSSVNQSHGTGIVNNGQGITGAKTSSIVGTVSETNGSLGNKLGATTAMASLAATTYWLAGIIVVLIIIAIVVYYYKVMRKKHGKRTGRRSR